MCLKPDSVSWHEDFSDWRDRNKFLFLKMYMSDCSFVVTCGTTQIIVPAHKYILGGFSLDFYNLFYRMEANSNEIPITDVSIRALKEFLRFVYTGEGNLCMEIIWDVLKLAVRYSSKILTSFCESFIIRKINEKNCLFVLNKCSEFKMTLINTICMHFIVKQTNLLKSPDFLEINQETLDIILKSDKLTITEMELYRIVLSWSEKNCLKNNIPVNPENMRLALGSAISNIRFASMNIKEFSECSDSNSILTQQEINQVYRFIGTDGKSECTFLSKKRNSCKKICHFSKKPKTKLLVGFTPCYFHFSVDKAVKFYGFGIYGRTNLSIEFKNSEVLSYRLANENVKNLLTGSAEVSYDGTDEIYNLMFERYAWLQPHIMYTICITRDNKGIFTNYFEENMLKRVKCDGVVFRQKFDWSIVASVLFE